MPQRGKLLVNTCTRVEWSRVALPTKIALLADSASSSGSTLRMAVEIATARSAPRTPACRCRAQVLFVQAM